MAEDRLPVDEIRSWVEGRATKWFSARVEKLRNQAVRECAAMSSSATLDQLRFQAGVIEGYRRVLSEVEKLVPAEGTA